MLSLEDNAAGLEIGRAWNCIKFLYWCVRRQIAPNTGCVQGTCNITNRRLSLRHYQLRGRTQTADDLNSKQNVDPHRSLTDRCSGAVLFNHIRMPELKATSSVIRSVARDVQWPGFISNMPWRARASCHGFEHEMSADNYNSLQLQQELCRHPDEGRNPTVKLRPAVGIPQLMPTTCTTDMITDQLTQRAEGIGDRLFNVLLYSDAYVLENEDRCQQYCEVRGSCCNTRCQSSPFFSSRR